MTDVFPSAAAASVEWINLTDTVCYARKPARCQADAQLFKCLDIHQTT